MYFLLFVLLLAAGLTLLVTGIKRQRRIRAGLGGAVLLGTFLLYVLLGFWGEMLWFHQLGFARRFWTVILARIGFGALGAVLSAMIVFLLTLPIPHRRTLSRFWPEAAAAALGGIIGFGSWDVVLMFLHRVPEGLAEPILNRDTGFYLFSLPFLQVVYRLLFLLGFIALAAALAAAFVRISNEDVELEVPDAKRYYRPLYGILAYLLLLFAGGQILSRYELLTSRLGVVTGPGWTDVHVRMPGYVLVAVISALFAVLLLIPPLRRLFALFRGQGGQADTGQRLAAVIAPPAIVLVVAALALLFAPGLLQWLRVEPNEITMERDYIKHNIRFTRHAFGLDRMEEREFPAEEDLTRTMVENNRDLMSEIRLWDWRALADVYEQFQEIRLYYTFPDVDIDRYTLGEDYRQVMVSPREMDLESLAEDSQTFVNKRFKYTHGYGLTMSSVRDFTPEGLPNLLIQDIPPQAKHPSLTVDRPEIYYGMLTRTPVVANTEEKEFDYPSGDQNVYSRYQGRGGVPLVNLWRKFVFGWKFDGTRFFLSGYPTAESRVLFHRHIVDRVRQVAPFLTYEPDPYVVLHAGRIYWIIDAYTTSQKYPYSEAFTSREQFGSALNQGNPALSGPVAEHFRGKNYVRNAVKAVIDAYHGDVSFYVFDEQDPLIQVWRNIFPDVFQSREAMPQGLREHVRYPASHLLTQGLVFTKYHMTDPAVFYNQEDLWVRATEKYYQEVQPVPPYYVMWKAPGTQGLQFALILPFTPKNKQVLIGWMAALCDGDNYGRLFTYKFPKEKRMLGPQQVETKIDQDPHLSGQLTLWDQRGSKVIRGNVLAIPIDETLMYVEPIYLQAETAAYPELRLVAVMHNDQLSYAETFDQALQGLLQPEQAGPPAGIRRGAAPEGRDALIQQAKQSFNAYLRLQGEKKFAEAADALRRLQQALDQLGVADAAE